ncbi:dienelactone hydrolase family protein [Chitinophaga sp. Cy-1792]|uniref:dienelactone hydrolase family protein n=1 Tax=Chitinophaga sp. Cy-1792 TaxID=2608339 RepID=UPI001422385F|nr:dienelactone hydrolase family protein [Chitinophaga sp. Cy-1792]NIG54711.1 dienelactone hydrolase family protein [Chitinophaga sp. Cy-1792]
MYKLIVMTALIFSGLAASAQNLKTVNYTEGSQKLSGLVTSNAGKKLPGVLILPAWMGIDEEAKHAALELEKQGYIAFVADIYGVGNTPADNAGAGKLSSQYKQDYKAYQRRIAAALEQLKKEGATKVAVIGYCFGGSGALEAARGELPVVGIVSIHGGLAKAADRKNGPISAKMLIENPADDGSVKPEDMANLITEMNEGKADWQIITYAHSKHTFTNPTSPDYNEVMAKRAWQHTLMFLKEIL